MTRLIIILDWQSPFPRLAATFHSSFSGEISMKRYGFPFVFPAITFGYVIGPEWKKRDLFPIEQVRHPGPDAA